MLWLVLLFWQHTVLAHSVGFTQCDLFHHFKIFMHSHCLIWFFLHRQWLVVIDKSSPNQWSSNLEHISDDNKMLYASCLPTLCQRFSKLTQFKENIIVQSTTKTYNDIMWWSYLMIKWQPLWMLVYIRGLIVK